MTGTRSGNATNAAQTKMNQYTDTEVRAMAEDKKPAESSKPDRPEGRQFPPPGPERIVKTGTGPVLR